MQYYLETQELCKHYHDFKALNGLNLHVPQGAVYGLDPQGIIEIRELISKLNRERRITILKYVPQPGRGSAAECGRCIQRICHYHRP